MPHNDEIALPLDPIYREIPNSLAMANMKRHNKSIRHYNFLRSKYVEKCWNCPHFTSGSGKCVRCLKTMEKAEKIQKSK